MGNIAVTGMDTASLTHQMIIHDKIPAILNSGAEDGFIHPRIKKVIKASGPIQKGTDFNNLALVAKFRHYICAHSCE